MIIGNQKKKTVFILGAGATRGAVKHVLIEKKRLKAPLNRDFFKVAETFVRANSQNTAVKERYDRLRNVFKKELPLKKKGELPTMEEAFSLLYVTKDFPEIYSSRQGRKRKAGTRPEIKDFLLLTFQILSAIESKTRDGGSTLYDELADRLGEGDTIITLNYDTLLDSALVRKGWNPAEGYAISGGTKKMRWTLPKSQQTARMRQVKLLKLHGSLNWYVRGSFDKLSKVFNSRPKKILEPRKNELNGFIRQIVPPIYGKFFEHPHWQKLWFLAYEALLDADAVVIIGCSLVDTDFHLSGLISRAVAVRKEKKHPFHHAVVVDRDRKWVRKKWFKVLKGCVQKRDVFPHFEAFMRGI